MPSAPIDTRRFSTDLQAGRWWDPSLNLWAGGTAGKDASERADAGAFCRGGCPDALLGSKRRWPPGGSGENSTGYA